METDQLHSLMNGTEALMYTEFKELIEAKLNNDDSCLSKMDKWQLRTALTEIEVGLNPFTAGVTLLRHRK